MMVSVSSPAGYWPMQELDGDKCVDQAYFTSAGAGARGPGGGNKGNGNKGNGSEVTSALPLAARFAVSALECVLLCLLVGDTRPKP
jgi:hypothetical protein